VADVTWAEAKQALKDINNYFNEKLPSDLAEIVGAERMYCSPTLKWEPELGTWEVWWEDGPPEWAYRFDGSSAEETRVLLKQAAVEFGKKYVPPKDREQLVLRNSLQYDALYSFAVFLYKEGK
jgi:hypothetical protein